MTTPHGNASFICSSFTPTLTGAKWLVNYTMVEDIIDINITTEFSNSVGIGRLNLTNIPMAYNDTNITCIAQLASGREEVTASVLIQGLYRIERTLYSRPHFIMGIPMVYKHRSKCVVSGASAASEATLSSCQLRFAI